MFIHFNDLSEESRLWVYGSETILTIEKQEIISNQLTSFLESWEYHQKKLTASFKIFENRFIIVALDDSEHGVGGCSMDGLQRLIQSFEQNLSISLMNRLNVFYKTEEGIKVTPSFKLSSVANSDTLFFDLTIQKKREIDTYLKPIAEGWCSSFL